MADTNAGQSGGGEVRAKLVSFVRMRFPAAVNMRLDDDASLLDSGVIDSLGILDIVSYLEETFGVKVADEDLVPSNLESIGALTRFVAAKRG